MVSERLDTGSDFNSRATIAHRVLSGFTAGLLVGTAVLGVGGRLVMMLVAASVGARLAWSWGGTFQVVLMGLTLGPPAGIVYALIEKRLSGGPGVRGLLFGGGFGALMVALYFLRPAGPVELSVSPVLGAISFAVLLLGFGYLTGIIELRLRQKAISRALPTWSAVLLTLLAVGGASVGLYALLSR